jgi:hypothetical protein
MKFIINKPLDPWYRKRVKYVADKNGVMFMSRGLKVRAYSPADIDIVHSGFLVWLGHNTECCNAKKEYNEGWDRWNCSKCGKRV